LENDKPLIKRTKKMNKPLQMTSFCKVAGAFYSEVRNGIKEKKKRRKV